jgi:hypothetical protein
VKSLRWPQEIQDTHTVAEVAFTGDTTIDFLNGTSPSTQLALTAKLLIMELTFLDDTVSVEKARVNLPPPLFPPKILACLDLQREKRMTVFTVRLPPDLAWLIGLTCWRGREFLVICVTFLGFLLDY